MKLFSVMELRDGGYALLCIENERTKTLNKATVESKIESLKNYRGVLFVQNGDTDDNHIPDRAKELGLPLIREENVVYVFVTAVGCMVESLDDIDLGDLNAQIFHVGSESLLGPNLSLFPAAQLFAK